MRAFFLTLALLVALPAIPSAQTLQRIKETGQITIGFRTDAAPLSFLGNNQPSGFTPNICFALAEKIGAHLEMTDIDVIFQPIDTENRFEKVASGEIDLLCGAATITLTRQEIVDFSIPVYVDGATVALKKDGPETLEGLAGMKIGVRSGTTTADALANTLQAQQVDAEIVRFADHPSGLAALKGDAIQAYFADQSILMNMILREETPEDFKVMEELLTVEKQGLAMARGDSDFRLVVDRGLSELFASGAIRETFERTVPGATPGFALEAMFLIAPTLP